MARRTGPPRAEVRAELSLDEMRAAIPRINRCLDKLREFDPNTVDDRSDPRIGVLRAAVNRTLVSIFGPDTVDYKRYAPAEVLDTASVYMNRSTSISEVRIGLAKGLERSIALLEEARDGIGEEIELQSAIVAVVRPQVPEAKPDVSRRRVFVVHGHDEEAKQTLARFLQQIDLVPIILHEQVNQGRTIIEKFEENADVGFAVVLVTPDDVGGSKNETNLKSRARENVILELGYFVGALGRTRVCALRRGEVDLPSDYLGVVYTDMDTAGAWKTRLAREIDAAGIEIDFRKAATA